MIKIGIVSEKDGIQIQNLILTLLSITPLNAKTVEVDAQRAGQAPVTDVSIVCINPNHAKIKERFNILILNAENNYEYQNMLVSMLTEKDYVITNADNTDVFKKVQIRKGILITCGFHPKACVTTSSVLHSEYTTVQVCIQRGFQNMNGNMIEEQEFSIDIFSEGSNVFHLLSAITSVLACGVKIHTICE